MFFFGDESPLETNCFDCYVIKQNLVQIGVEKAKYCSEVVERLRLWVNAAPIWEYVSHIIRKQNQRDLWKALGFDDLAHFQFRIGQQYIVNF